MKKYKVHYGYGNRELCSAYGENITVTTIKGNFICRGIINGDETVIVSTIE